MTDYTELVRSLRNCSNNRCAPCDCGWFDKYQVDESCKGIIMWKAADAIEALQAENPIVETVLVDKMRQQMEETVCHCNVKENAELIARILDDDVDGKVFELPKRGQYVHGRELSREYIGDCLVSIDYEDWRCSVCGIVFEQWSIPKYNYCPNCGAKMEAQNG